MNWPDFIYVIFEYEDINKKMTDLRINFGDRIFFGLLSVSQNIWLLELNAHS